MEKPNARDGAFETVAVLATARPHADASFMQKVRIHGYSYFVHYESQAQIQELKAEFLSKLTRGKAKPPGKDGKVRTLFRCVMCGRDDFCSKWSLNHHRFVMGCPSNGGKTTFPYPDMETGQGKTGEMFRKGKAVQFTVEHHARKPKSGVGRGFKRTTTTAKDPEQNISYNPSGDVQPEEGGKRAKRVSIRSTTSKAQSPSSKEDESETETTGENKEGSDINEDKGVDQGRQGHDGRDLEDLKEGDESPIEQEMLGVGVNNMDVEDDQFKVRSLSLVVAML